MEHTHLGSTGLRVSRICLGMMSYGDPSWREWALGEEDAGPLVQKAADVGITFYDTANMYSRGVSEEITGRLLKKVFARREHYVVATKVYFPVGDGPNDSGLSRGHILDSIEASLRRLDLDYVDLYQIHRFDPETPVEETMETLNDCVRSGMVRYIGASSMPAWQFAKAQHAADRNGWTKFVTMQNHYNLLYREEEREMIPQCRDMGVGLLPWSPQARGLLTRPRSEQESTHRGGTDQLSDSFYGESNLGIVDAVADVAAELGVPMAQVALAWVLSRPGVTSPIVGATKPGHLDDAVAALDVQLSEAQVNRLEQQYRPRRTAEY